MHDKTKQDSKKNVVWKWATSTLGLCAVSTLVFAQPGGSKAVSVASTEQLEGKSYLDLQAIIQEGEKLSAQQASALGARLVFNPKDFASRLRLLGYYERLSIQRQPPRQEIPELAEVALGFIEHHPRSQMAGEVLLLVTVHSPSAYEQGAKLWMQHVQANPKDPKILGHAGAYLMGTVLQFQHRDQGEAMLQEARKLDPKNPEWPEKLAELYDNDRTRSRANPAARTAAATKELEALEEAYRLTSDTHKATLRPRGQHVFYGLVSAAFFAGETEKAKAYGTNLLKSVNKEEESWNYGNAIHRANVLLGHIALRENRIDQAARHLLEGGKTPGSPQLNSFGPDMSLAKALLEKGQRETVVQYLDLCASFWKMDKGRLAKWKQAIQAGQAPDFGQSGQL